jgi:FKBP-type peptidyl-prolyl cis-trans isomerase FkpA
MKSRYFFGCAAFLLILFIAACSTDQEGFNKTDNGLYYKVIESGKGKELPETGDLLIMDIEYRNNRDSVLFDSETKSDSFTVVLVEPTYKGGIEEGFAMMHEGDHWQFKVSADSVFLRTFFHESLPPYIEPGSYLKFQVKLQRIIKKSVADSLARAEDIRLRQNEFSKIELYLRQENMDVMPTQNGAYIKTIKAGNGIVADSGDSVVVNYTGKTLDGREFDKVTDAEGSLRFVAGTGMVLPGWDEVIPYLDEGSVSIVVLPSDLTFGATGYGDLPGYTTLVFEIEVKQIIKSSNSQKK